MLAQSVSSQYNMAGVRTEDSIREFEGKKCFVLLKNLSKQWFSSLANPSTPGLRKYCAVGDTLLHCVRLSLFTTTGYKNACGPMGSVLPVVDCVKE